ncbi:unnamed protein product [Ixodes hexagonus]
MVAEDCGDEGSPMLFGGGSRCSGRPASPPPPTPRTAGGQEGTQRGQHGHHCLPEQWAKPQMPTRGYARGASLNHGHRGKCKTPSLGATSSRATSSLLRRVEATHPRCLGSPDSSGVQTGVYTGATSTGIATRADPRSVESRSGGTCRAGRKGSSLSSVTLQSKVQVPLLCRPEGQQISSHTGPQGTQPVGGTQPLQDGGVAFGKRSHSAGRLYDTHRLEGCLSVCTNIPPGPLLARIPGGGQGLPLECSALRSEVGAKGVHKTPEASSGPPKGQGPTHRHLPGRYSRDGPVPLPIGEPGTAHRKPSREPRFRGELHEVCTSA